MSNAHGIRKIRARFLMVGLLQGFAILFALHLNQDNAHAQMMAGFYVEESENLTPDGLQLLEDKLKTSITAAGYTAYQGYFPIAIIAHYNEIEIIPSEGIRTTYQVIGNISLHIVAGSGVGSLGSVEAEVSGTGVNKETAIRTAFRSIAIPKQSIAAMFESAKKEYPKILENWSATQFQAAMSAYRKRNFVTSIGLAAAIPPDAPQYEKAQNLMETAAKDAYAETERDRKEALRREQRDFEADQEQSQDFHQTLREALKAYAASADASHARADARQSYIESLSLKTPQK